MSLYGALFAGVSGLTSQANKLGVISDNVANVNTVGYKGGLGSFETLVTSASATARYSPGGVLGGSRQLVSKQGLLQATDSATDIAVSGKGFFVVNSEVDGTGQVSFTRAGSFRADSTGNFRNAAGYYLQAWPLDGEGRLPGQPGNVNSTSSANITSLRIVNVQNLTGVAAATSGISVGANLNSSQTVFPGAAGRMGMDSISNDNFGISAKSIIVPSTVNDIARGDKMVITTGSGLAFTYRYGGFTYGRDVSDATNGESEVDLMDDSTAFTGGAANPFEFTDGSNVVIVHHTAHGLTDNDVVTLSGNTSAMAGIPSSQFNGKFLIDVLDDDSYAITVSTNASTTTLSTNAFTVQSTGLSPNVQVVMPSASHGFSIGQEITFSGVGTVQGINMNNTFTVTNVSGATLTFAATGQTSIGNGTPGGAAGEALMTTGGGTTITALTRPFQGNILDATNVNTRFLATTGTSGFTTDSMSFKITTAATGTVSFTYTNSAPDVRQKQFNNLTNLAAAINEVAGLSARVVDNKLYVGATDANAAVTFQNGSSAGTAGPPVQAGIDWVRELGLQDIGSGVNRFSTLEGLKNLALTDTGISATIENPLGKSVLSINVDDPRDTITFADSSTKAPLAAFTSATPFSVTSGSKVVTVTHPEAHSFSTGDFVEFASLGAFSTDGFTEADFNGKRFEITVTSPTEYTITMSTEATGSGAFGATGLVVTPHNNRGSLVAELGLVDSLNNVAYTTAGPQETEAAGPSYQPTNSDLNMSSGNIPAHFSRPIRVFDALGTGHDLNMSFLKTAVNTWSIEIYAVPASDVTTSLPNGLLFYGDVVFNGDGTLREVDATLADPQPITWTNGSSASTVTLNLGTPGQIAGTPGVDIGKADGLSQFSAAYQVSFVNQNGAPVGELTGVSITSEGKIVASYTNGQTQALFKIPLADFSNPDQLTSNSGNVFLQSANSGEVNLREPGTSGVGDIAASSLEASNVELSQELTDMIIAQRSYQANAKVISTSDNMLEELNQIIR